jgi:hypothetical protein
MSFVFVRLPQVQGAKAPLGAVFQWKSVHLLFGEGPLEKLHDENMALIVRDLEAVLLLPSTLFPNSTFSQYRN